MELPALPRFVAELERFGKRTAFVDRGRFRSERLSYRQLGELWRAMAAGLSARSVAPGDRVVIYDSPSSLWAAAFYACIGSGAIAVPVDSQSSPELMRRIAERAGARLILGPPGLAGATPLAELAGRALARGPALRAPGEGELLEIVYTSGTTAAPRGVEITHGNLLANLRPIAREVERYRFPLGLVSPLSFVHLIPLSHLFGQVTALFIPQLLGATVVFESSTPERIERAVWQERASVVVCVPQQLEALGRHVAARSGYDPLELANAAPRSLLARCWRYRRARRLLGLKAWAFVVGGASLPEATERLWSELGFAVIQGYGLTETAPAVSISHPLRLRRGSVGKGLPGVEIRIAGDGEVLVRGPNVTRGYFGDPAATRELFEAGWLKTGDLGRLDAEGNLAILGRKKDVIVAADGRNIHPEDVEATLGGDPRLAECGVVGRELGGRSRVHAVLLLAPQVPESAGAEIVARANALLEPQQRVQSWSLARGGRLPRTSTGKLKRAELRASLDQSGEPPAPSAASPLARALERFAAGGAAPEARLEEDLGLTSLDRVELELELESATGATIDEAAFARARTVADLAGLVAEARSPGATPASGSEARSPRWPLSAPARAIGEALQREVLLLLLGIFVKVEVVGLEHLESLEPPVLFASTHASLLDVPVIASALPPCWRYRLAPAMGRERFARALEPFGRPIAAAIGQRLKLWLARLLFNGYVLPEGAGLRAALAHTGLLADRGFTPLIFPEGARTRDGRLGPLRPGAGVIASELALPIVPVRLDGLFEILPTGARWPRRGRASVRFGPALEAAGQPPRAITAELGRRLAGLGPPA